MQGGRGYNKIMRHLFLPLLSILPLFLTPVVVLGAEAKPKAAEADRPSGGDQAPNEPKADSDAEKRDAEKPDSDKVEADQPQPRKITSRPTSIDIIPEPGGLKTLNIHFRWSLYPKASIEMRLVPAPVPKGMTVAPILFSKYLTGTVQEAFYTCLDHLGEGGKSHSFTKGKIVYNMIGRRNSLGNQGVHVYVHPEDSDAPQSKALPPGAHVQIHLNRLDDVETPDPNPGVAYLQLDTWAVNQDTLSLDLAREEFAKSGTLFVWFFRGDQVVWDEQIRWPGYK